MRNDGVSIKKNIFVMIKDGYVKWVLNILLILMLAFLFFVVYWTSADYEVLVPGEENYSISKTTYKQGEVLDIHLNLCKNMNFQEDIFGRFVDGVIYAVPENTTNFEVDCYDTTLAAVKVPDSLPEGNYVYREQIVYQVNPLRQITYTFETPEFEVVEN